MLEERIAIAFQTLKQVSNGYERAKLVRACVRACIWELHSDTESLVNLMLKPFHVVNVALLLHENSNPSFKLSLILHCCFTRTQTLLSS